MHTILHIIYMGMHYGYVRKANWKSCWCLREGKWCEWWSHGGYSFILFYFFQKGRRTKTTDFFLMFIYLFLRGWGRERGDRGSEADSVLTAEPGDHDLSLSQTFNLLSHPSASKMTEFLINVLLFTIT